MFSPDRLPATIGQLTAAQADEPVREIERLREHIAEADRRLGSYRAALDASGDLAVVSAWITEAHSRKIAARACLDALTGSRPARPTRDEITAMVHSIISGIVKLLASSGDVDRTELHAQLWLRLTSADVPGDLGQRPPTLPLQPRQPALHT